jgi:hypothetical protein
MSEPNNGSPEEAVPERAPLNPRTEEALRALQRLAEEDPHVAELLERLAHEGGRGLGVKLKGDLIGVFMGYRAPIPPPEMLWRYESQGQSLYALGTVAASVSGVLIAFFTGKKANLREKEEKRELLKELMGPPERGKEGLKDQEQKGKPPRHPYRLDRYAARGVKEGHDPA